MDPVVRHLDLFSGIGGFALACRMVGGIETVAFCEREPYCQRILAKHWPNVPICNDIHDLKGDEYGAVDLVTGGFPCQPYSTSGKRKGRADERSLWHELVRVVSVAKPSWVIGENVAGFTSMDLDDLCDALEQEDYETQPMLIPACAVGAPHIRQRCWILAHLRTWDTRQGMESIASAGRGDGSVGEAEVPSADRRLGDACGNETDRNDVRPDKERWRELERGVGGIVYGVRHRPHRFRGLGNAIVPQVAAEIIRAMMQADRQANPQVSRDGGKEVT